MAKSSLRFFFSIYIYYFSLQEIAWPPLGRPSFFFFFSAPRAHWLFPLTIFPAPRWKSLLMEKLVDIYTWEWERVQKKKNNAEANCRPQINTQSFQGFFLSLSCLFFHSFFFHSFCFLYFYFILFYFFDIVVIKQRDKELINWLMRDKRMDFFFNKEKMFLT